MLNRLYIASKGLAKFATAKRNHIAGESLLRKLHLISANVFRQPDWRRDLKPSWIKIGVKSDLCLQVSNGIIVAQVKPDDYDDDECEHSIKYVTDLSTMQPMEGIARTKWSRHTAMAVANAYSEYSFRKRFHLDTRVPLRNRCKNG